jgi:hypothetical protein
VSGHAYGGREHDEGVVDEKCLLCALEEERALRQDNRRWAERAEAQLAAATERADAAERAERHVARAHREAEAQLAAAREALTRCPACGLFAGAAPGEPSGAAGRPPGEEKP